MKITSGNIEFGYELISVIPYACYLASIGELEETESAIDTKCLYFFSPKHKENTHSRAFYNIPKVTYPNIRIHKPYLDKKQFKAPDYKTHFANKRFKFNKETIVICNRYNIEWGHGPINYFDLPTLGKMFNLLQDKYQVVYINIKGKDKYYDSDQKVLDLGDYEFLKNFPKVINIHDLHEKNKDLTFNEIQLMIFANCSKFVTMNGGHSILTAYFGGENIIYSKFGNPMAQELRIENNSFYRWYHEFGEQRVVHVADYGELLHRIEIQWIKKEPIVNILVRTSGRPNYFKECINSILSQTYENINIYTSIDDKANDYTVKYPVYPVFVDKKTDIEYIDGNEDFGKIFPYNDYLNDLQARVKSGLILILDDDDLYTDKRAVEKIVNQYKQGKELIFWRVKISEGVIIPEVSKLGKEPELYKISMIGFAYDSKYKEKFLPYKRADFRVAKKLFERIRNIGTINEVLAATQDGSHFGQKVDKNTINKKNEEMKRNKVQVRIINDRNKHGVFDVKIGSIIELTDNVAETWVKTGVAEYLDKPKKIIPKVEPKPVIEKKEIAPERKEQVKEFAEKVLKETKPLKKSNKRKRK